MITLNLDWHEVLWWMKGGIAGSHLCWNVYEDMVNRVWPTSTTLLTQLKRLHAS